MSDPLGLIGNSNVGGAGGLPGTPKTPGQQDGPSFKDVLMQNIEQVNRLQQDAEMAIEDLVTGRRDDVDQVMMAKQKSDLAFQMLLQVRNKMVDAYEEIKQMRV
ncbi:MAG TPA: flagellar hook-basal body complex protein FliE [Phycisphaerales bacterium]|nr:flagellar hook-basal body complex protein FliE [Phycisphaerales bacterium]HCD34692.1 flagellar hook-basal body complex protein FliE [Phycisphaerales bacterium]|tara:strand:+ start:241 stop:552 length:312 start_codon:yes stop_codon:yes gene_type:complete